MKVLKGTVQAYKPSETPNKMWVRLDNNSFFDTEVIYTSPTYQRHYYGMFAMPPMGSEVLVAFDGIKYYYLSTIVDYHTTYGSESVGPGDKPLPLFSDSMMTTTSGVPATMMFKNDLNAGLDIKNFKSMNPITESPDPIVNQVELRSSAGHRLLLSDSPQTNCVILENTNHDGIMIGGKVPIGSFGKPGMPLAMGQIKITSTYDHMCVVKKGSYRLNVKEGQDITIKNESRGFNSLFAVDPLAVPGPGYRPSLMFGNINLITKFRDINIYTDNPAPGVVPPPGFSNIFISTSNGLIQLKSGGDIVIYSVGKTTVESVGDLNLVSQTGNVNIQAGLGITAKALVGNVDIQATQAANVVGFASTNLGSGATPVTLNSVVQQPIAPLVPTVPQFNVYGK